MHHGWNPIILTSMNVILVHDVTGTCICQNSYITDTRLSLYASVYTECTRMSITPKETLIKSKSQSCSYWLHWLIAQAQQPPFPNQLASGCWKCLAVTGGGLVAKSVLQSKTSLKWCQSPTDFCGSPTVAIYSELCWNCEFKRRSFYLEAKRPQFSCRVFTGNLQALGSFSPGDFQQPLANQRMLVFATREIQIFPQHTLYTNMK